MFLNVTFKAAITILVAPEADAEYFERNAAKHGCGQPSISAVLTVGIMLIIQIQILDLNLPIHTGFNDLAALEAETLAFSKPVVLVHGDSHSFQINKPLFGSKVSDG